ncbi:hypothetical protein PRIPAC_76478 [Pristionchus pacificus]|uniref:Uncharacterized protein n=1 Tax=Pristionchus pacificus TaxID=54126 RepID=A0A2A6CFD5_PRIPA|nr:hypothetical protein PRIPAC_76478 [Pristionchus pacificus]|eukprot:PDM76955.1 hypothetical protein PRIPAC_42350 [Pristionchus pacificus]
MGKRSEQTDWWLPKTFLNGQLATNRPNCWEWWRRERRKITEPRRASCDEDGVGNKSRMRRPSNLVDEFQRRPRSFWTTSLDRSISGTRLLKVELLDE